MTGNEHLEKWLEKHHSDVLERAKDYIAEREGWDLMDCTDQVASNIYDYWCEYGYTETDL